ncbi:uncharacterized protein LOC21398744 [Morus notabilis]|uniref:uncharacterized protein LOC21398744 n=1 Tax=Morus notabilis TaxID=981085 RepID=UPI000CED4F99|nr:uncharacterized protein LOC21398744 [Morus notabilis]
MQRVSFLCSSNPLPQALTALPTFHGLAIPFRSRPISTVTVSSPSRLPLSRLLIPRLSLSPLQNTATQEHVETAETDLGFVEVGYISNVHGLQGEARVKPNTDFPELRFCEPGRRWLKQQVSGRETIQEVELEEGRGHPGQKSWILKFRGIDTVDQAKQLIGSTLLVREEERPALEEGEFYTRDLVGMRVFLKETGELVGTVVNVYDSGGNDLLQVMLDSSVDVLDATGKQKSAGTKVAGHLVWVPFVEAIVPIVDLKKGEMQIVPPNGLLELNLRFDERSKKERRQLEWKERKKYQKRLIAAKKKLCEMEQKHVFHGLRFGEKAERSLLADQIVGVNLKLLQQVLRSVETPSRRWSRTELVGAMKRKLLRTLVVSEECLTSTARKEKLGAHFPLREKGLQLASKGKVAIVLVINGTKAQGVAGDFDDVNSESTENLTESLETLLLDDQRFIRMENRASVPLILIGSAHEIESLKTLFSENDYFSFDPEKVHFLEEEKLPVVSNSLEEAKRHKILMKSPWEILQSPVGSGGAFSLLSSNDILDNLHEQGVEYVEITSTSQRHAGLNPLLLGYVESSKADTGIQMPKEAKDFEESFNMIFSMSFLKKLTKQIDKLGFQVIPKQYSHVEFVEKDWVDVVPSTPNSYEFCCSIYSLLNVCSFDKVCLMEVAD